MHYQGHLLLQLSTLVLASIIKSGYSIFALKHEIRHSTAPRENAILDVSCKGSENYTPLFICALFCALQGHLLLQLSTLVLASIIKVDIRFLH